MAESDELFQPSETQLQTLRDLQSTGAICVSYEGMAVHAAFVDGNRWGKAVIQGSCLLSASFVVGVPVLAFLHIVPWWMVLVAWVAVWNWQKILGGMLRRSLTKIALNNARAFRHWYESGYLVIYLENQVIKFPALWTESLSIIELPSSET